MKQFYPPAPVVIDGVPCRPNIFYGSVELHENGRLKSALLDAAWEFDGQRFRRGSRIELDETGKPVPPPMPLFEYQG